MDLFCRNDILIYQPKSDEAYYAPGDHVGNRRFQVLLNIYRPIFLDAKKRSDEEECKRISLLIVDTIYHQCVPNGQLFIKKNISINVKEEWQRIAPENATAIVRLGLGRLIKHHLPSIDKIKKSKQARVMAVKKAREVKAHNEAIAKANVNLSDERFKVKNVFPASCKRYKVGDDKLKTIGRVEKMTPKPTIDLVGRTPRIDDHKSSFTSLNSVGIPKISVHKNDVLFESCDKGVLPVYNNGNNYFRIMIAINRQKFMTSDIKNKLKVVNKIFNSMKNLNPPSRFLSKDSKVDIWYEIDLGTIYKLVAREFKRRDRKSVV